MSIACSAVCFVFGLWLMQLGDRTYRVLSLTDAECLAIMRNLFYSRSVWQCVHCCHGSFSCAFTRFVAPVHSCRCMLCLLGPWDPATLLVYKHSYAHDATLPDCGVPMEPFAWLKQKGEGFCIGAQALRGSCCRLTEQQLNPGKGLLRHSSGGGLCISCSLTIAAWPFGLAGLHSLWPDGQYGLLV
jgi:hypothetical protein